MAFNGKAHESVALFFIVYQKNTQPDYSGKNISRQLSFSPDLFINLDNIARPLI